MERKEKPQFESSELKPPTIVQQLREDLVNFVREFRGLSLRLTTYILAGTAAGMLLEAF